MKNNDNENNIKNNSVKRRLKFVDFDLIKDLKENSGVLQTRSRSCTILPLMVGRTIEVYNGKIFIPVQINDDMVGYKLGSFSPTRIFPDHSKVKDSKKTSAAKPKGGKK